jgi:endo-1,3-1,4-beta-glycanase ExoK
VAGQDADAKGAERQGGQAFFDDFDELDPGRWFVSDGWANGPHQSCLWHRDRVSLEEGVLRLSLTTDAQGDRALSCAEIQSNEAFGHGTFEALVRMPFASGLNANFFTHIGAPQERPHNEIDFEFIAPHGPQLQTNFFVDDKGGHEELLDVVDDSSFRHLAVTWEPGALRWYIDGELIREESGEPMPSEAQKIYLSLWTTDTLTEWLGAFDPSTAPLVMDVDWVAFTPLGADCQFDASILCSQ